jgi:hypothetical protein
VISQNGSLVCAELVVFAKVVVFAEVAVRLIMVGWAVPGAEAMH